MDPLLTGDVQVTVPLPPATLVVMVQLWIVALQVASVPPFVPAHVQLQGPVPVTVDAVPVAHKLLVGTAVIIVPLALLHLPLTGNEENVAIIAAVLLIEQLPVPLHSPPDHPVKIDP